MPASPSQTNHHPPLLFVPTAVTTVTWRRSVSVTYAHSCLPLPANWNRSSSSPVARDGRLVLSKSYAMSPSRVGEAVRAGTRGPDRRTCQRAPSGVPSRAAAAAVNPRTRPDTNLFTPSAGFGTRCSRIYDDPPAPSVGVFLLVLSLRREKDIL